MQVGVGVLFSIRVPAPPVAGADGLGSFIRGRQRKYGLAMQSYGGGTHKLYGHTLDVWYPLVLA